MPILNDTAHYYAHYLNLASTYQYKNTSIFAINTNDRFDIGFLVFEKFLIKYISQDPYTIIFISSLITTFCLISFFKKRTNNISIALFITIASSNLFIFYSAIRQAIAVELFFLAYIFLEKKKIKIYLFICIIAFLFHSSAIILILPLILTHLKFNKKNIIILSIICFIISIQTYFLMEYFGLSSSNYYEVGLLRDSFPLAPFLNTIMTLSMIIISIYLGKKYNISRPNNILCWTSILPFFFGIASCFNGIIGRYGMYFSLYTIILLLYYLERIPSRTKKTIISIIIILLYFRFIIVLIYRPEWDHLYPFKFYDFNQIFHEYNLGY